jgi:predicted RNA-binding protein with PUA-like domain
MNYWLLKTEPSDYSFHDLLRDKQTTWTGVKNAMALIHLRAMKKGDTLLIYHTGSEKSVVGIAKVASGPRKASDSATERGVVIDVRAVRAFARGVPISLLRKDAAFAKWDLVRNSRLSVMPVTTEIFEKIVAIGNGMD